MKKKIGMVLWVIVLVAVLAGLGYYGYGFTKMKTTGNVHPVATFNIKNGDKEGVVKFELYPEYAPNTVTNFIKLIDCGYYDGKIVYGKDEVCMYIGRASGEETKATEKDATAEGETAADATATDAAADTTEDAAVVTTDTESTVKKGDVINPKWSTIDPEVEEDSDADYEYSIKGEFYNNDFKQNTLSHEKWVLSMIRNDYSGVLQTQSTELVKEGYNSGNSQIGIMMSDKSWSDRNLYDELFNIICDVVCVPRKTIRIGGEDYPYQLVKSKFLKLTSSHLQYVIGCISNNTTKVNNIKAYLITSLYNAPNTMYHYYTAEVNHDLYGVG